MICGIVLCILLIILVIVDSTELPFTRTKFFTLTHTLLYVIMIIYIFFIPYFL